jgi:hypothetical protein
MAETAETNFDRRFLHIYRFLLFWEEAEFWNAVGYDTELLLEDKDEDVMKEQ